MDSWLQSLVKNNPNLLNPHSEPAEFATMLKTQIASLTKPLRLFGRPVSSCSQTLTTLARLFYNVDAIS
jgi:hypothetical protein